MKVYEYVKILFKKSIYSIFERNEKNQPNHHFKTLSLCQPNFISFISFSNCWKLIRKNIREQQKKTTKAEKTLEKLLCKLFYYV